MKVIAGILNQLNLNLNFLIMALEIVTKEDLQEFKNDLLQELKNLLLPKTNNQKQWLRSADVKALLKISSGTLQNMRINGTLRYSKVGGTLYYNYEDIEKLLQSNNQSITNHHVTLSINRRFTNEVHEATITQHPTPII